MNTEAGPRPIQFAERVYSVVAQIPSGRVMTYGEIAALCGSPRAARIVGGLAHFGPERLPWHRVVNKRGGLASGFHGGRSMQRQLLEAEGVQVNEAYLVDVDRLLWWPQQSSKCIVILGPTASGKTALAIELALKYNGEIICADSKTFYKGMNIGTAKPTLREQKIVPHHMLDIIEPNQTLGVATFKQMAESLIADIISRGKIPFLVGGSGLYIDSVIYDYQFPLENPALRLEHASLSLKELVDKLHIVDRIAYETIDLHNRRRVERALETVNMGKTKLASVPPNFLVLGMSTNKECIQHRIQLRIEKMLEEGFLNEVSWLGNRYGWDCEAMSGIGYRAFKDVVLGTESIEVGKQRFIKGDMQLVKKQLTWFKRNQSIEWITSTAQAITFVERFLAPGSV